MNHTKHFMYSLRLALVAFIVIAALLPVPSFAFDSEDSQIFLTGFNAYQKKAYKTTINQMDSLLKKYPDSPLRDMALFWLARAHYMAGNRTEAARNMAQFLADYPTSPLKSTVNEDLMALATRYARGEPLTAPPAERTERQRVGPAERKVAESAATANDAAAKAAAAKALAEKAGAEKAVADKAAAEKSAAEKTARDKATEAQAAAARASAEKATADKEAAERSAAAKAAAEKAAEEKAAAERAAAEKAAAERAAAEKATAEKAAAAKAAAEKAAAEKAAAEKAAAERAAARKAAEERAAAEKAAAERAAAEKAAAEKAAALRAAAEKAAAERAAQEKAAAEKAAAEKAAAEKAAAENAAAEKALEKASLERAAADQCMREKAIAEYRAVIERYPSTPAAAAAAAKLKAMGVTSASEAAGGPVKLNEMAQVLNLEVKQFADFEMFAVDPSVPLQTGTRFAIPLELVNEGNGSDSFTLESGFPAEYGVIFAAASELAKPITATPEMAVGQRLHLIASGSVPRALADGQRVSYPLRAASRFSRDVVKTKDVHFSVAAPLLKTLIKAEKTKLVPGEKVAYRISLMNIGSAGAEGLMMSLRYPPQYELVEVSGVKLREQSKGLVVVEGLEVKAGESRSFEVCFRVREDAQPQQELALRAEVSGGDLVAPLSSASGASVIEPASGVSAKVKAEKLDVVPGQVVAIPIEVTNSGSRREDFAIRPLIPGRSSYAFYLDSNGDGKRQGSEPVVNHVGPLDPKEKAHLVLEMMTLPSENDGAVLPVSVMLKPEEENGRRAIVHVDLRFSRPILDLTLTSRGPGKLAPGEISSMELDFVNHGSGTAKQVELRSVFPSLVEVVASDPPYVFDGNGSYGWRFSELGPGERRTIVVTYRVMGGTVGTNMQLKNTLSYQDISGNKY